MITQCVLFGEMYRHTPHPVDGRAHPDGWFEYAGTDFDVIHRALHRHLGGQYSHVVSMGSPDLAWCPNGRLARFVVDPVGNMWEDM